MLVYFIVFYILNLQNMLNTYDILTNNTEPVPSIWHPHNITRGSWTGASLLNLDCLIPAPELVSDNMFGLCLGLRICTSN